MISKTAVNPKSFHQNMYYYHRARDAFSQILRAVPSETVVLLPAYIGFSEREGSGVFDPVASSGLSYEFYGLDQMLRIDLSSFTDACKRNQGNALVLLIHYFGYVDPQYQKAVEIANQYRCSIVEDCAHAFFTAIHDGLCGGTCGIYSLHKMFPFDDGGMLVLSDENEDFKDIGLHSEAETYELMSYRFRDISERRKENARIWENCLQGMPGITILRPESLYAGQTPQTFPILLSNADRNEFYFEMNRRGFGVVSLYHTMIAPIQHGNWPDSAFVANHITNLPVHQDVTEEMIVEMYGVMKLVLEGNV